MLNNLSSTIHAIEAKIESEISNVVYYALIFFIVGIREACCLANKNH